MDIKDFLPKIIVKSYDGIDVNFFNFSGTLTLIFWIAISNNE